MGCVIFDVYLFMHTSWPSSLHLVFLQICVAALSLIMHRPDFVFVQGSQKRALNTPENPHSKRSVALLVSPGLLLSPASFSPRY